MNKDEMIKGIKSKLGEYAQLRDGLSLRNFDKPYSALKVEQKRKVFCSFCGFLKNKYYPHVKGVAYTRDWLDAVSEVWPYIAPKEKQDNTLNLFS